MTRDEVNAMTDDELLVKAAELMGIEPWTCKDGTYSILGIPDYQNDMTEALGLLPFLIEMDGGGMGRQYAFAEYFNDLVDEDEYDGDENRVSSLALSPDHTMARLLFRELTPRAITKAFILAMDK